MPVAINLNGEAEFMAIEIEHIGIDRVLASKFHAHLAAAHEPPQHEFGLGLSLAKAPCQLDEMGWRFLVEGIGMRQGSWCGRQA